MSLNTALAPDVAPPRPRATAAHPVARLIVQRVALGVVTLWVVSVIIFAATVALPGNAATAILGHSATPAQLHALEAQLHLNRPVFDQYGSWIGGILTGNPGKSLANGLPVWGIVGPAALNSAVLVAVSGIIASIIGVTLGVVAAVRKDSFFDHASSVLALAVTSLPEFVVAITLIILFATVVWHVLPAVSLLAPGTYAWANPRELILPVVTLVIVTVPYITRMTRAAMVEALASDYVEMARLKGLPTRRILVVHALPNAVAPVAQVLGLTFLYLAGGIVVVEYVFAYPGIGQSLVNAVTNRDVPVIQMIVLLLAAFYVLVNILADVVALLATPRRRLPR
jgi:peptide/nickel transport system permease protein